MSDQEHKPDPTLERSAKYISNYLKFHMKDDLAEVLNPLCQIIQKAINVILGERNGK